MRLQEVREHREVCLDEPSLAVQTACPGPRVTGSATTHPLHYSCPDRAKSLAAALRCPSHDTPQGGDCPVRACHQLCWSLQPPPSLASSGMLFPFRATAGPSQAPQCQHGRPLGSPASGKTAVCQSATCTHSRLLYWDQQAGPSAVVVRQRVGISPAPASQEKMSPKRGDSTLKFRVINLSP